VCETCGAPVSPLRRAQTAARGAVICGPCEAAASPPVPVLPAPVDDREPVCERCGFPVSHSRRAQTLARGAGVICGPCEAALPGLGGAAAREGRRGQ
jgi:predicted SprT family Zn-dependent metalloprotease